MAESVDLLKKINQIRIRKLFPALDDTRDTKRPSELPCVILYFSAEDDYQRNIYIWPKIWKMRGSTLVGGNFRHGHHGPSRLSASPLLVIFATAWHPAHKREEVKFPGERWDPRSELLNNQNPQSGPKNWIKTAIRCDHRIRRSV